MKSILSLFCVVAIALAGCTPNPKSPPDPSSSSVINAEELARLLDMHVWRLSISPTQVFSSAQLIIVEPDGKVLRQFGTSYEIPQAHWTNLLLGLRFEQGRAVGQLVTKDANLRTMTWKVDFTNAGLNDVRSWTSGYLKWDGNRAPLAHLKTTNSPASADSADNILAIELVKAPPQ